jgi:hypothetical protein
MSELRFEMALPLPEPPAESRNATYLILGNGTRRCTPFFGFAILRFAVSFCSARPFAFGLSVAGSVAGTKLLPSHPLTSAVTRGAFPSLTVADRADDKSTIGAALGARSHKTTAGLTHSLEMADRLQLKLDHHRHCRLRCAIFIACNT